MAARWKVRGYDAAGKLIRLGYAGGEKERDARRALFAAAHEVVRVEALERTGAGWVVVDLDAPPPPPLAVAARALIEQARLCGFRDPIGHPLENNAAFRALVGATALTLEGV